MAVFLSVKGVGNNLLNFEECMDGECRDVFEVASVQEKTKCSCKGWNFADDVREVTWHILVECIFCCRAGEKMNEMQCL